MQNRTFMNGNFGPSPAPSTDKRCYQSRMGVKPTSNKGFLPGNTKEDGMRAMYHGRVEAYTSINDRMPNSMERGIAKDQGSMGRYDNNFKDNI